MSKTKELQDLQNLIDIQSQDGNWNWDEYNHGMLNGMILAQALMMGMTEPEFVDPPKVWLCDFDRLEKFNNSGVVITPKDIDK